MVEILISLVVVAIVVYALWWIGGKMPSPLGEGVRIVAVAGGVIWLLLHVRELIHAIVSAKP